MFKTQYAKCFANVTRENLISATIFRSFIVLKYLSVQLIVSLTKSFKNDIPSLASKSTFRTDLSNVP